jgi:hypothetical protein
MYIAAQAALRYAARCGNATRTIKERAWGPLSYRRHALKLFDPAVLLPELDIETSDYLLSLFPRRFVIIADEINGFDEMTIPTKKVRSVVRHVSSSSRSALTRRNGGQSAIVSVQELS